MKSLRSILNHLLNLILNTYFFFFKHKKSPAQVVLRWEIQRGIVVIPKSVHIDRMKQNFDVFDFNLSDDDMNIIVGLDQNKPLFRNQQDPVDVKWFVEVVGKKK